MNPSNEPLHWRYRPFPELVRLAWPIVTSLLSYSVMTLVDALFVARLGANAIAATGLGATAAFGVLCFGIGLLSGAKVRVSEAVGAGRLDELPRWLSAFLRVALVLGAVSAVLGGLVSLALPSISADVSAGLWARSYCQIRSLGIPVSLVIGALAQFRQATGDSRAAMRAALVANVLHVPLNALFIFGLGWGVRGAGIASVLCAVLEAALLLHTQYQDGLSWRAADARSAWVAFRFGLPTGIERWLDSAAFVALVALLARMGAVQLAAHQITLQILHFCFLPLIALGDAVCVLVAQAEGARQPEAGRRVIRYAFGVAASFGVVCALVLLAFGNRLVLGFTQDPTVLRATRSVLEIAALLQFVNTSFMVLKGALRGFGDLRFVALVSVVCAWVFTPPLAWWFGYHLGWGAAGGWLGLLVEISVASACLGQRLLTRVRIRASLSEASAVSLASSGSLS
ncbi:MAG TPA: MATE family efflux transporter [Polyangiaceae bacterium]|nr:MATE family efflux transporter [Polyangiaceae bacterium]